MSPAPSGGTASSGSLQRPRAIALDAAGRLYVFDESSQRIQMRNQFGSDSRKVTMRAGEDLTVTSVLKPAFAIVSVSGSSPEQDVRIIVARALAAAGTVTLVAPPAAEAEKALKANQLTAEWLSVDAAGRPLGAAAQIAGPLRKDASSRLADAFRTQGVASITMIDQSRAILALLNAGSSTPDVIAVALDSTASIAAAVAKLDRSLSLSTTTIGLQVIDVADVGVVVVATDASAPTIRPGDIVVQVDGQPATDGAALVTTVNARRAGDSIPVDVRDASGAPKRAELKVMAAPRVIGLSEQGLLPNRLLLDLRARLADAQDPLDQSVIRLNMAVALARIGDWGAARAELQRVKLPEQPGVGNGTVQYLLGLAAENLGDRAEAEAAFKMAAASESLLTDAGPPVKELAESRLLELQKTAK